MRGSLPEGRTALTGLNEESGGFRESRIIGHSPLIQALKRQIRRVGPTETTVLIVGERGTGKELVAGALEEASRRHGRPYVKVNCAALPAELLASELFGHERGAFTGAHERKPGLIRAADGGTIFLDEVGDLAAAGQAMLLRFMQERELRPIGSVRTSEVNIRILAATNRNLELSVTRGDFRADLYDRLSEIVLEVPPLRQRRHDVVVLTNYFLALHARRHGIPRPSIAPVALRRLLTWSWPGNVRELKNRISRAVVLADRDRIRSRDLALPPTRGAAGTYVVPGISWPLTERQHEALSLAARRGFVRPGDLVAQFGISRESARHDLAFLAEAGLLRRLGRGRGARYSRT